MGMLFSNRITVQYTLLLHDLNPIENAWGYLVHHVYKDGKQYYSLNDLREAIIREWDGMTQDFIKKLIDSMPKRVAKVVEVNGNAIGY